MILMAERETRMLTSWMSSVLLKNVRASMAALCDSLRELPEWKALGKNAANAERLAKLRRWHGFAPHHLEEAVAPLEHIAWPRHAFLGELHRKDRLAAGHPQPQKPSSSTAHRIGPDVSPCC